MRYTIEARELTNEYSHPSSHGQPQQTVVDANDAGEAITRYVRDSQSELVCVTHPSRGQESIATVRKEDAVYLVRVYAD